MTNVPKLITQLSVMLICSSAPLFATVVFDLNDVVLDGGIGENTFITRNSASDGGLVYNGGTPSLTYSLNAANGYSYFSSNFDAQSLSNVGDGIEVSYSFTPTGAGTFKNQENAFRVGFYDSKGTLVTSDSTSSGQSAFNDDKGYMALYSPRMATQPSDEFYQRTGSNNNLWTSSTRTAVSGSPDLTSPSTGAVTGLFRVELISPTSIQLTSQINGSASQSIVDLSGLETSFDMVSFFAMSGGGSQSLTFDEMTVTVIPEPSSLVLIMGAAGLFLISGVRRRSLKSRK
ncbi:PEP-CTERM sorting domain-containing protein [Kiritimatiellota bacterium B12222]|nr:PEP-CTERM sorting domain-containing protein [Kiritimatiellota bacterium B12222]